MASSLPSPLAVQVLTKASLTMIVQVLADDPQAQVTGLSAAPLPSPRPQVRYERLRLAWQGPTGSGERALLLKALPTLTWSEAIAPSLPAPAEVLMVETEGFRRFSAVIDDPSIAAGRRHESRPAWILYEEVTEIPTVAQAAPVDAEARLLVGSAAFHAPYWGTLDALEELGLPRFGTWVEEQCRFLGGLLGLTEQAETAYARWALAEWPTLTQALPAAWASLDTDVRAPLKRLLTQPAPLLDAIAASPHAVLHGDWHAGNLRWREGLLLVSGWDLMQVGPTAWDLYCLLHAPAPDALATYLAQLATHRSITEAERQSGQRVYALCPLLHTLLHPSEEAPQAWLRRLGEQGAALT